MELLTIGYRGRSLPGFVKTLQENGITRLVDVRERPQSRKKDFSARALFDALRKAGIADESDPRLGNPVQIRVLLKDGSIFQGRREYRRFLRNGRKPRVVRLSGLARVDRVCILCFEDDADACHRSVIAEEVTRLEPTLAVRHL